jgi:hypothetical protein
MGEIDSLRNAERIGTENRGNTQQSMIDRGLYNTTAYDNAMGAVGADLAARQGAIRSDFAGRRADATMGFAESAGGGGGGYQAMGSALGMMLSQGEGANKSGVDAASKNPGPTNQSTGDVMLDSSSYTSPADRMRSGGGPNMLQTASMTSAPQSVALAGNRKAATRRRAKTGGYGSLMI